MNGKNISRKIIVNDPIHEVMDFGSDQKFRETLKSVVDTIEFQRLRRISQLGLASYVFPGATHSRFCHSLGAAHLARQALDSLGEIHPIRKEEMDEVRAELILSALLHDVGHGPFSHSFENVLKDLKKEDGFSKLDAPMHEEWTAEIIRSPMSAINSALIQAKINPELVASPFLKNPTESYKKYLKQIVSSQIDVDRMDYLVRDSHFAGVSIGKIDLHYLINCLHIVDQGSDQLSLGLTPKGIKVYESFVVARQLMNRSIYYHHKVKLLEFMVEETFRKIISQVPQLLAHPDLKNLIPKYLIAVHGARSESNFDKKNFMAVNLQSYVNLTEDSFWTLGNRLVSDPANESTFPDLYKMFDSLFKRRLLDSYQIAAGKEQVVSDSLESDELKKDVDFKIIKLETTMYKAEGESVFVTGWDGRNQDVSKCSELIGAFKGKAEVEWLIVVLNASHKNLITQKLLAITPETVRDCAFEAA